MSPEDLASSTNSNRRQGSSHCEKFRVDQFETPLAHQLVVLKAGKWAFYKALEFNGKVKLTTPLKKIGMSEV